MQQDINLFTFGYVVYLSKFGEYKYYNVFKVRFLIKKCWKNVSFYFFLINDDWFSLWYIWIRIPEEKYSLQHN